MVIWNAEDVPSMDMGGMSDVYAYTWIDQMLDEKKMDSAYLQTDTHWFCQNGCPNWNWRCVWDYTITDVDEEHNLRIQLFDKDLFSHDELIGEADIDFNTVAKFC